MLAAAQGIDIGINSHLSSSVKALSHPCQMKQHPGVAQGVGLDVLQIQELGHTLVVGGQKLGVDLRGDGVPWIVTESVPAKKSTSKVRQKTRRRPSSRAVLMSAETIRWPIPSPRHAGSTATVRISARSSQSTCSAPQPTTSPSALGDPELLDVLVQGDGGLLQQPRSGAGVGVDEAPDRPDVRRAGTPDDDLGVCGLRLRGLRRPAPWTSSVRARCLITAHP